MAKKVNNINYKGINHSPSLVSDNDGNANECVNLSPDFNDLKPMPMPVKMSDEYTVTTDCVVVFVHEGVGYENFVELHSDGDKLFIRDSEGNYLYAIKPPDFPYWSNESDVIAIESVGDTLVISTRTGTEYLVYQRDVPLSGFATSSYKWLGQKPPMPVIEFRLQEETDPIKEYYDEFPTGADFFHWYYSSGNHYYVDYGNENDYVTIFQSLISKIDKRCAKDNMFYKPFFVRYALRLKTGDYILHSPQVLMLPSTDRCPIATILRGNATNAILSAWTCVYVSKLMYKVNASSVFDDWSDIVDGIDIFISEPIDNYDYTTLSGGTVTGNRIELDDFTTHDYGQRFTDGDIKTTQFTTWFQDAYAWLFVVKEYSEAEIMSKVTGTSLFHKVASLDLSDVSINTSFKELPAEDLTNLATLPTLPDDFNSHCAVSPSLMQTYNNRLNMANVKQEVFDGFTNAFQPQSNDGEYVAGSTHIKITNSYFKVKKNGKTIVVRNQLGSISPGAPMLDYTSYLYYPDQDCFEAVVSCKIGANTIRYATIPMKRHEYLNGSYWYDDMKCLGQYISEMDVNSMSQYMPGTDTGADKWYDLPNRFMMSSVGNPWHFPVANMFEIGTGEIRALSLNAENMDSYQYGKNPIYVFSSDGIWTINIKETGEFNYLSYVSGDTISGTTTLGSSPTASSEQVVFFKTTRGVMMVHGNDVKEIDLQMKGRVFNPKTKLLPANTVYDGIPTSGVMAYLIDLIDYTCDDIPYADFAADSDLIYDYTNKRLLLFNKDMPYLYVYDVRNDFWSKMLPLVVDETAPTPSWSTRTQSYTSFLCSVMAGSKAVMQDTDGYIWYVGEQPDENDIPQRQFCFYVSRPMRFGTDDYKTLSRIVHDTQLSNIDSVSIALYGSRDGKGYYRIRSLRGTSYKFFIIVLYFYALPSSRYAYTAFEWEHRLADKIR